MQFSCFIAFLSRKTIIRVGLIDLLSKFHEVTFLLSDLLNINTTTLLLQHFKDIMQIRRTDGELLRKQTQKASSKGSTSDDLDKDAADAESESQLTVNREKCIPVVKGLMALILSMDFTCNVDLFLVACKVK